MNILVITPDGDIGRQIVAELLSPEFTLRVIADDPAVLPEEWRDQVAVIAGPMDSAETVSRALADVKSVLWCRPAGAGHEVERFARTLSQAMQETRTARLVTIATINSALIPCTDFTCGRLALIEDILNKSGAAIRHLCCDPSTEKWLPPWQSVLNNRTFPLPISGDMLLPLVVNEDVIDVALRCLVRRDWQGVEKQIVPRSKPVLL